MTHKLFINEFCARLMKCKVKFLQEKIGTDEITLPFMFKETADTISIESIISNQLAILGLEWHYLPFSDDCHTWLISGKQAQSVWHIVVYKEAGRMTIQWKSQTNQQVTNPIDKQKSSVIIITQCETKVKQSD